MKERLFEKCCRLCLDDTKQQLEIRSVERLDEALLDLYDLKISSKDRCSQNICVECYEDVSETQKWLEQLEKQKQLILANQARFREELLEQLGPEQAIADVVQEKPAEKTPSAAATRVTRRSTRKVPEVVSPKLKTSPIKKEPVATRSIKRKLDWEPPQSEQESETTTEATSNTEEEAVSEITTTTTTEAEFKCNKCEAVFEDIETLGNHTCEYTCSICSKTMATKWNLRRHLIETHNIARSQWQDYWTPKGYGKDAQSLLVETSRPKKRYRYESDSPTDIEESSNDQAPRTDVEIICNYCGVRFDSQQDLKTHDCDVRCNICGMTFAKRNYVRNHKIRVHRIEPSDPSLATPKSRPVSRMGSRPPSRAVAEHPSDDEPLSVLANKPDEPAQGNELEKTPGKLRYRYFCTECDYSNMKRYRLKAHLIEKHNLNEQQIDVDAIPREVSRDGSKTPDRSKTPQPRYSSGARSTPKLPAVAKMPTDNGSMEQLSDSTVPKTPDLLTALLESHQPRVRSKSTYMDNFDIDYNRKRSYSSCSGKLSRAARSRSNPPPDRQSASAKRRASTSQSQPKVHPKFRPLLVGIDANRLHVSIQMGCELQQPTNQQVRIRASSYHTEDPSSTKRLFRLKAPAGGEKQKVLLLRDLFHRMSQRVGKQSNVASLDVESLVLDPVGNQSAPIESNADLINQSIPVPIMMSCPEGEVFEVREVDTQNVTTIYQSGSEVVQVVDSAASAEYNAPRNSKKKKAKGKKGKRRKTNVGREPDHAGQESCLTPAEETDLLNREIKLEKLEKSSHEPTEGESETLGDGAAFMEGMAPNKPSDSFPEGLTAGDSNALNKQNAVSAGAEVNRIVNEEAGMPEPDPNLNQPVEVPPSELCSLADQANEQIGKDPEEMETNPPEAMDVCQVEEVVTDGEIVDHQDNVEQTQDTEPTRVDDGDPESEIPPDTPEEATATSSPMEVDERAVGMSPVEDDNTESDAGEGCLITPD